MTVAEPVVVAHTEIETPAEGKVTLRCPWADRHAVIESVFGDSQLVWPYWPETGWIPLTFSIKGTPGVRTGVEVGAMNSYHTADIELTFGSPEGSSGTSAPSYGSPGGGSDIEVLYYETFQPNGEMLKLPPRLEGKWLFRWQPSKTLGEEVTAEEAPTRLIIGIDYVIRWVGLETVPDAFFDAPDHVNSANVETSVGRTFGPETLLCQSPVITRTVTTQAAAPLWEVEARFSYRKDGWNKFWSPQHAAFRTMYRFEPFNEHAGEEYKNFPTYDFGPMLP